MSVTAYMRGGLQKTGALPSNGGDPTRAQYYLHQAANQQREAIDGLKAAKLALAENQAGLAAARDKAKRLLDQVNAKRKAAEAAESSQRTLLNRVQGDVARLVAAERARRTTPPRTATAPRATRGRGIGTPPTGDNPAPNAAAQGAVEEAKKHLGKPYKYGASGPNSFDCSGLTSWAWRVGGGRSLPHSSRAQYSATSRIPLNEIAPGDLLFNGKSVGSIHHVGIYVGGGKMISAPQTGDVVKYQNAFRSDVIGVGRVN